MSLALIVYLVFTALPAISKLSFLAFACWAILTGVCILGWVMMCGEEDNQESAWEWIRDILLKKWAKYAIICLFVANLVPTKEVTAYMLGAYGVQTIAENEKVQELGAEGLDVLQSLMKKAKAEIEGPDGSATPKEKAN